MRICLQKTGCIHFQLWQCRSLGTSSLSQLPKSAVLQLSNAELLDVVKEGQEDPVLERDGLDMEHDGSQPPTMQLNLPGSPLTDPRLLKARHRHHEAKPLPSKDKSEFQTRLLKNPYAQALATPTRLCLFTGVRVPSYLLIPFGLETDPRTGAPWHLPRLVTAPLQKRNSNTGLDCNSNSTTPPPLRASSITGTHFLASQKVLRHISSLPRNRYERVLPYRWKLVSALKLADIVWREDMDTLVLEILRENVYRTLVYLAQGPADYVRTCRSLEHVSEHKQVGAVLWLGSETGATIKEGFLNEVETPAGGAGGSGPPPYAMHNYRGHYIPIYNLPHLLGQAKIHALRQTDGIHFGNEYAVIRIKRLTTGVQSDLWKLLGYLA